MGKTSILEHLKKILPADEYEVRDIDERGVPDGGGQVWLDAETRHWIDIANLNALTGKNTVITGFTNPEQFKKIHNPDKDVPAQIILLDASVDALKKRLYGRHVTPESRKEIERAAGVSLDEFVEQCVSFLPELRKVFERYNLPIVDTDNKTPETIAREVAKIILKAD